MQQNRLLTEELFQVINSYLFPELKNKNISHPQFIITFSGVPGTGKTSIAKKLEERYRAVRINNDYIRQIITSQNLASSEENAEQLLQEYGFHLLPHLPLPNKRTVLDKSIDRRYRWFLDTCRNYGFKYFLIRLDISSADRALRMLGKRELITDREKNSMRRWIREYQDCVKNLEADIVLDAENPDLRGLFRRLDSVLVK